MKHMKKIISLLLAITILVLPLSACGNKVYPNAKKYGYFNFPNTDWGMTLEEVAKALHKDVSDFKEYTAERSDDDNTESRPNYGDTVDKSYTTTMDVLGDKDINVLFTFRAGYLVNELRLVNVLYAFLDTNEEKYNEVWQKVDEYIKSQDVEYTMSTIDHGPLHRKVFSTTPIKELDKSTQEEIQAYYDKVAEKYGDQVNVIHNSFSFSQVNVTFFTSPDDNKQKMQVSFSGGQLKFLYYDK